MKIFYKSTPQSLHSLMIQRPRTPTAIFLPWLTLWDHIGNIPQKHIYDFLSRPVVMQDLGDFANIRYLLSGELSDAIRTFIGQVLDCFRMIAWLGKCRVTRRHLLHMVCQHEYGGTY